MSSYCCAYCPAVFKSAEAITKHLETCKGRECSILKAELDNFKGVRYVNKRLAEEVKALRKLLKKCRNRLINLDGFDDDNKDLIEEIETKLQENSNDCHQERRNPDQQRNGDSPAAGAGEEGGDGDNLPG